MMPYRPTREMIAVILRSKGYAHDEEQDIHDLYWVAPDGCIRPMLSHLAREMSVELQRPTPGWDTYAVSVAR